MPQDSSRARTARLPGHQTEAAGERTEVREDRKWLTQFLSSWRISDRGKLAATATLALLRGRAGRALLKRLAVGSIFITYKHWRIVETIVGILVVAEVAARLIHLFTRGTRADRGVPPIRTSAPSTSPSNDGDARRTSSPSTSTSNDAYASRNSAPSTSTSNDGYSSRTGPTRRTPRQIEIIQSHLEKLAMAAAAADGAGSTASTTPSPWNHHQGEDLRPTAPSLLNYPQQGHLRPAAPPDGAPSLLDYHQREWLTVEYPDTNGTAVPNTTFNSSGSNFPPAARSFAADIHGVNPSPSSNSWTASSASAGASSGQAGHSNPDSRAIVTSPHPRKHGTELDGPCKEVPDRAQLLVIRFRLPVYVCDLTFWNEIRITVPSASRLSSPPPSSVTTAKNYRTTEDRARTSRSNGTSSDAAGHSCHIKMRMWVEMNSDLVAKRASTRNVNNQCQDCLMGSHSVKKRRLDCTYLGGRLDGNLDVHKNTFHADRKLAILGSTNGLNFKFDTALEQTIPRLASDGPAAFQQRVTFTLLPRTSRLNGQTSKHPQQSDGGGSSPNIQGGSGSGLLAAVLRKTASSRLTPVAKCTVESSYALEDRRLLRTDNCGNSSGLGQGESGLDQRLFGSTIASSS